VVQLADLVAGQVDVLLVGEQLGQVLEGLGALLPPLVDLLHVRVLH
jgi:hypothetical protein